MPDVARVAPHNLEAEQALLGAMLVNNEAHDRVSGFLEPQHFFDPLHAAIYEAAAKLIAAGKRANPITLKPYFGNADPVGAIPVPVYLGQLAANATTIINVRDYGRTVYDLATRRQLIWIGESMVNAAYDSPIDFPPKEQIEEAETRLYALAERGHGDRSEVDHPTILDAAVRLIEDAYRNPGTLAGLSTGLVDLDKRIGGLRPGHLLIVGGRPAMAKPASPATSWMLRPRRRCSSQWRWLARKSPSVNWLLRPALRLTRCSAVNWTRSRCAKSSPPRRGSASGRSS
jgi:replicative DNA helicase